jgi:formylglycine-generating enzyme required for sulfatase activity
MQALLQTIRALVLFGTLTVGLLAGPSVPRAQTPTAATPAKAEPHIGPVEETLVGVEVTNTGADGNRQTRYGNGFVLRCDGVILAPAGLFSRKMLDKDETAFKQTVAIVLHPGTDRQQRLPGHLPRYLAPNLGVTVCKLDSIHTPCLRTLLPDTLKPGDTVEVVWSAWNAGRHAYEALRRAPALLAEPPKDTSQLPPGAIRFTAPLEDAPAGAVVIGPDGLAVGLAPGTGVPASLAGFVSFDVLKQVTNAATPVPTPDTLFASSPANIVENPALRPKDTTGAPPDVPEGPPPAGTQPQPPVAPATGTGTQPTPPKAPTRVVPGAMVSVPGGPVTLPRKLLAYQPDLEGATTVCVPPFKIDRYEVTNREYYAFWKSLPEKNRAVVYAAYYPLSWAPIEPAFSDEVAGLPVLGVSLEGAEAYARWKGKRLPTPYEWCRAAFGAGGDAQPPDWVRRYLDDRQRTWQRIRQQHLQYLRTHLDVPWATFEMPDCLPWLAGEPDTLPVTNWSKQVVETETTHLWEKWLAPDYVLPPGSRPFDISPFGAMDMILNAAERVTPWPGPPHNRAGLSLQIDWQPASPWPDGPPDLWPFHIPIPPLSRLIQRAPLSPDRQLLLTHSSLSETESLMLPLAGWSVHLVENRSEVLPWAHPLGDYAEIGDDSHVIGKRLHAVDVDAGELYTRLLESPGAQLWAGTPRHFHREMGRPLPTTESADNLPLPNPGQDRAPELYYLFPGGFRCAR